MKVPFVQSLIRARNRLAFLWLVNESLLQNRRELCYRLTAGGNTVLAFVSFRVYPADMFASRKMQEKAGWN